jgi:hypothetical protein
MIALIKRLMASPSPVAAPPAERRPTPTELFDQRYAKQIAEKRTWLLERGITEPKPVIGLKVRR